MTGLCLWQLTLLTSTFAQPKVQFSINPANGRKAISPLIYGTNDHYPNAGAKRLGGNRITNYNWENNASNAGYDWQHSSDNYVPWQQGVPDSQFDAPGTALQAFHQRSLAQKAYSLVTLPMAKYVARDKNGTVSLEQAAPSDRWARVNYRKSGPLSLQPDLGDAAVYADEEVNFLLHHFGSSNTPTGVKGYALDNEPGLWFHSHPRQWGTTHVSVRYLLDNSIELAGRIKELDPTAEVFGPASWGITEFENLQFAPDWDQEKGAYPTFIDLYLGQMHTREQQTGKRLLDVLDVHWYPQANNNGVNPFGNGTDYATNAVRMAMTRSLWDPTYTENTWVGNDPFKVQQFLPFLPKMQQHIQQYYPGTKLAITEYSYMGISHASGGIAQADALGIFGRQGIYLATYWGAVSEYIKAGFDLYRNYDGKGGHFGDTSVESATNDLANTSVFAAINGNDDSKLQVIALNKNQDGPVTATLTINGSRQYKSAQVWAFDNTGLALRQLKSVRTITNNTFEYSLPALSACHFVLTEEDLSVHPEITQATLSSSVGYSDGTASFAISVNVHDGNNDISSVTADLSSVGGSNAVALMPSTEAGQYRLQVHVPNGTESGLKAIRITATDATGHTAQTTLSYRIITKTTATVLWDGDEVRKGKGEKFYDEQDAKAARAGIQRVETGGNSGPGSLFMHIEHGTNYYNAFTWRLSDNNNPADARNISDYGALEFYLKSNAPDNADIEVSLRDATAGLNSSTPVLIRQGGYLGSLSSPGYTRVKIPLSAFSSGSTINLEQVWQLNFVCNTATKGFDVWIDDIRVTPYSNPVLQPIIRAVTCSPTAGYADGKTKVTIAARVDDPDNNLRQVSVDLAPLGLAKNQVLALQNDWYTTTVTLPGYLLKGTKQLNVSAVDADGNTGDAPLLFTVHEQASSLVLWDGDVVNTGKPTALNEVTTCVVDDANGNQAPKSMKMHFDMSTDQVAAVVWDWNENTNDEAIRDLSTKGYLTFYVKVDNPGADFDLQVFLKDRFAASTSPIYVRRGGYLNTFSGTYQQVRIPMSALWAGDKIDRKQVTRIGFLSTGLSRAYDFWIDDIVAGGSNVADIKLTTRNAACGSNGRIQVTAVNGSENTSAYTYYLNKTVNPAGPHVAVFDNLVPGTYELRIEGSDGFAYGEQVIVGGTTQAISVSINQMNTTLALTVTGGSGQYTYQWSNGATTQNLTNATPGTYSVRVTDQVSGCVAEASAVVEKADTCEKPVIKATVTVKNGKGYIELDVTGGSGIYTFNWSEGSETRNLWEVADGTYQVKVTDAATGCSSTASYTVVIPKIEVRTVDPACAANGRIRVTSVSGLGTTPQFYLNGQPNSAGINVAEFSGLPSGLYRLKVVGDGGVAVEQDVELAGSDSAPAVKGDISYTNGKGYINLNVTGGSGIYGYEWSNGATTLNVWEVPPGSYSVVVTDLASGCKSTYSATIDGSAESMMIYPNPATGQESVWIKYNFVGDAIRKIRLTDHVGQLIYSADVPEGATELTLPIQNLKTGTYQVTLEGKRVISKHLIIR